MKEITLTNSDFKGIIDDEDYERVSKYKWFLVKGKCTNYIQSTKRIQGKTKSLHRFIMKETNPKIDTDHKNRNGLDNRKINLRQATNTQNQLNKKKPKNNTSGFKGVIKRGNKWVAQIRINKKNTYLGSFSTKEEAATIYDLVALYYYPEFAYVNFESSRKLEPLSIQDIKRK